MKRVFIMILTGILLAAGLLTGCGSQSVTSNTETKQTTNVTPSQASTVYTDSSQTTNVTPSQSTTVYTDSSQIINVNQNQEFTIALKANPTTGYNWQPVFDAALISQVKKDYQQDDTGGKEIVGSGGTDYFTFKALKAGQTNITLTYYRPWETPTPEDKQQVFAVVIQ